MQSQVEQKRPFFMISNGVGLPGAKRKGDFLSEWVAPHALRLEHRAAKDCGSCIRRMGYVPLGSCPRNSALEVRPKGKASSS